MKAVLTTTIMNNDDIAIHIDASHVHDVIHELYLVHRLHYTKQNLGNGHWNSVGNEVSDYRVFQPGTRQKIHIKKNRMATCARLLVCVIKTHLH